MAGQKRSATAEGKKVNKWNASHGPGTRVLVKLDNGDIRGTVTRSRAELLGGHSAVIWLEGIPGCYSLDRVEAV